MLTGIDCDTHKEEKQRGITINLGFSYLNLPTGESVGIIDVPGHKDFINTMIGGACGIDLVMLVIAADSGIMPQTVEHMNIISTLGIKKGVVVLTKSDLVDEELIEMAEFEITDFLSKTPLKDAPIVMVSAVTGTGKEELIQAIAGAISGIEERETGKLFRMYIDRIFSVKGFGSVVTGSVMSGSLSTGQDVYLLPGNKQKLRVRSIERHGITVERAIAGDRAAINLIGLKREDFERGMILCDKPVESTQMIDARVQLFDKDIILPIWSNIIFISGTFECQARLHLLNKDKVRGNEDAIAQIHLARPAVMMSKDKFIIRNSSEDKTLGGGYIIETSPLHHRKRTARLIDELTRMSTNILSNNSLKEMINAALKKEFRPFTSAEIAEKLNLKTEEISAEIENPDAEFKLYRSDADAILVSGQYDNSFREKILKILSENHSKNPLSAEGLELTELTGKLALNKINTGKIYLDLLLKQLQEENRLDCLNNTWIIKGHKPNFDKKSLEEIAWLEQEILNFGENKPVLSEIEDKAANRNIQKQKLKSYMTYLAVNGKIHFFKSDFIHSTILNKYRSLILSRLAENENGVEIMAFKESLGTKRLRALLIQILESEKLIWMETGAGVETTLFLTDAGKKLNTQT